MCAEGLRSSVSDACQTGIACRFFSLHRSSVFRTMMERRDLGARPWDWLEYR